MIAFESEYKRKFLLGEENSTKTKGANNAVVIIDQKSYTQLNEEDAAMSSQDRFGRPKTLIDGYVQQKVLETIDVFQIIYRCNS